MIRVVIADDQPLVRAGLRVLLGAQEGLEIVAEAATGGAAVAESARLAPDVVVMDIRMPGTDGIAATAQVVRQPRAPRVLVLTTYDTDEYVYDALAAGASGFLLKDARPEDLIDGVRMVAAGDALLAPAVTRRLISLFTGGIPVRARPGGRADTRLDGLTEREREVFGLVAQGLSNSEIGAALHVSGNTVKTHVARVLAKLGLRDRVHVVIFAYQSGLRPGELHRSRYDLRRSGTVVSALAHEVRARPIAVRDTSDSALIRQVKDDMRDWCLSKVIWVAARGFTSAEDSRCMRKGDGYIIGEKLRSGSADAAAALSRQGGTRMSPGTSRSRRSGATCPAT